MYNVFSMHLSRPCYIFLLVWEAKKHKVPTFILLRKLYLIYHNIEVYRFDFGRSTNLVFNLLVINREKNKWSLPMLPASFFFFF